MGVYKLVKGDDSFFSTVLTAGLAELPQGLAEARDAMERMGKPGRRDGSGKSACWPCSARWGR